MIAIAKYSSTIEYNLKTTLDSSGITKLQQEITQVEVKMRQMASQELLSSAQVSKAQQQINALRTSLNKSYNGKLGLIDWTKFNSEFTKAKGSVTQLTSSLSTMGIAGSKNVTSFISTLGQLETKTNAVSKTTEKIANTIGNTVRWGVVASGFQEVMNAAHDAVEYVKDLDTSLTNIMMVTDESRSSMNEYAKSANEAAKALGSTTVAMTDATTVFAQQGFNLDQSQQLATLSTKLANASQQDTSTTSDQITAYMNAYGMSDNMEELSKALDAWAEVANVSAADVEELATASQKAASTASTVGVNMDQLASQIATIESVTKDAPENIGNGLKTIYARFSDIGMGETLDDGVTLGTVTGTLDKIGVQVLDEAGKMRDVGDIMEDLMGVWNTMDSTSKNSVATTLAGKYQLSRFEALMNSSDMYEEYKQSAQEGKDKGTLDVMNEKYVDSLQGKLNQLQSTVEGIFTNLINSDDFYGFIDGLTNALNLINGMVDSLGDVQNILLGIGAVGGTVFRKQIGTGISNAITNVSKGKTIQENQTQKAQILQQFNARENELDDNQRAVLNFSTKSNEYAQRGVLSEDQIKKQNEIIQQLTASTIKAKESQEQYDAELKATQMAREYWDYDGAQQMFTKSKNGEIDYSGYRKTYNSDPKSMRLTSESKNVIANQASAAQDTYDTLAAHMTENTASSKGVMEWFNTWQKVASGSKEADQAIENLGTRLDEMNKKLNEAKDSGKGYSSAMGQVREKVLEMKKSIEETGSVTQEQIDDLQRLIQEGSKINRDVVLGKGNSTPEQLNNLGRSKDLDNDALKGDQNSANGFLNQVQQEDYSQRIAGIVTGLGSLAFAIQSVQNLGSIWSNDDLTIGDKILETITNLSMTIPMLVSGVSQMKDGWFATGEVFKAFYDTKIAKEGEDAAVTELATNATGQKAAADVSEAGSAEFSAIGTGLQQKAMEEEAVTAEVATGATISFGAALAASTGIIALAVAAVAGIVIGIKALVDMYNQAANAASDAKDQSDQFNESIQKTSSEYSTFSSNISAYEEARAALGNLTQGTDEYNNKLKEVNDNLLNALKIYPELAKYVSRDSNGALYINNSDLANFQQDYQNAQQKTSAISTMLDANYDEKALKSTETNARRKINYIANTDSGWNPISGEYTGISVATILSQEDYDAIQSLMKTRGEQSVYDAEAVGEAIGKAASEPMVKAIVSGGDTLIKAFQESQTQEKSIQLQKEQGLKDYLGSDYKASTASNNALSFMTKSGGEYDSAYNSALENYQDWSTSDLATKYAALIGGHTDGEKVKDAEGNDLDVTADTMKSALASAQAMQQAASDWQNVVNRFEEIAKSSFSQDVGFDTGSMLEKWTPNGKIDISDISKTKQRELSTWLEQNNDFTPEMLGIDDKWADNAGFESAQSFAESFSNGLEEALSKQTTLDDLLNEDSVPGIGTEQWTEQSEKIKSLIDELDELEKAYNKGYLSEDDYGNELIKLSSNYKNVSNQVNELKTAQKEAKTAQDAYSKAIKDGDENSEEAKTALENLQKAQKGLKETQSKLKGAMLLEEWADAKDKVNEYLDTLESTDSESEQCKDTINHLSDEFSSMLGVDISSWNENTKQAFFTNERNANDLRDALNGDYDAYMRLKVAASDQVYAEIKLDDSNFRSVLTGIQQYAMSDQFATLKAGATLDDSEFLNTLTQMILSAKLTAGQIDGICESLEAIGIHADIDWEEVPSEYEYSDASEANPGTIIGVKNTTWVPKNITYTKTGSSKDDYDNTFKTGTGGGGSANPYDGSGNSDSGGSGGSGDSGDSGSDDNYDDSTEEYLEDELDLYEKVNTELEKVEGHLDNISEDYDRLIGFNKTANMEEQIADYQKLIALQEEKLNIEKQEAEDYRNRLSSYGITFDSEGVVQNYADIYNQLKNNYNALVDEYNASTDKAYKETLKTQMEEAQDAFDKYNDYIDRYDELIGDEIQSTENQIKEYYHEIEDLRIEALEDAYEEIETLQDLENVWNKLQGMWSGYKSDSPFRQMIVDQADLADYFNMTASAASKMFNTIIKKNRELAEQATTDEERDRYNAIADWHEQAQNDFSADNNTGVIGYYTKFLEYMNSDDAKNLYGSNEAQYIEDLQQAYEDTANAILDAEEKYEDIIDDVIDAYDDINDKLEDRIDDYEDIADQLDHTLNQIETLFGDEQYDKTIKIAQKQADVYTQATAEAEKQLEYWNTQLTQAIAQGLDDEIIDDLKDKVQSAQETINDLAESAAEAVRKVYDTETDKYLSDFEEKVYGAYKTTDSEGNTVTWDSDFLNMQWEQAKTNADQYLDTVERTYQVEKLRNKYQQMMNDTNDPAIQKQIANAMNEQLNYLNRIDEATGEKVKLSEYDLEYANAQLEVLQKRIALEEAQRNKSQMKLKRDSQGNYSYVYTANEDDTLSAQQELSDAEYNGYEISKDNYSSQMDNYMSALNTFVENARSIREKYAGDEATATAQIQALWDQTSEYLAGIAQQMGVSETGMLDSIKQLALDSVGEVSNSYSDIASSMEENMEDALQNIGVAVNTGCVSQINNLEAVNEAAVDLEEEFSASATNFIDNANKIADAAKESYGDVTDAINDATKAQQELTSESSKFWNLVDEDTNVVNSQLSNLQSLKDALTDVKSEYSKTSQALKEALAQLEQKTAEASYWEGVANGTIDRGGNSGSSSDSDSDTVNGYAKDYETASGIAREIWTYGSWGNDPTRNAELAEAFGEDFAQWVQDILNEEIANSGGYSLVDYSSNKYSRQNILGYDTGGYTGSWSDKTDDEKNGKLALLHQKELVLNATDTQNILSAVDIIRNMTDSLKAGGLATSLNTVLQGLTDSTTNLGSSVEQDVHITAEFPNASDASEIREALLSLNDRAYQVASQVNDYSNSTSSWYYGD